MIDGVPAGIVHVAWLNPNTAWLEGMRVNPDFRRQGVANALDQRAIATARERGCKIARLATSVKNIAAQSLLEAGNYRRAARFNEWQAEPLRGDFSNLRVATGKDIDPILARWNRSEIRAASHSIVPNRHWRWTAIDRARLHEQIHRNEVRVSSNGFALLPTFDEGDWNGLSIHALGGDAEEIFSLALAVRGEAEHRGYAHIEAMAADHAPLNTALERAGFKTESGMFLYEHDL